MADDPYAVLSNGGAPAHWGMTFTKEIHRKPSPSINPANVTLPGGYTVIITGAGKGIGEHIAKAYVEAKAENLIITSRTAADLERVKSELEGIASSQDRKIDVSICPGDTTDPESYQSIAKILESKYGGRLDCVVLNAGGGDLKEATLPLHEQKLSTFKWTTELNYMAPYYGIMTLLPFLLKSESKTIINIVSGAAQLVNMPPQVYGLAKLASVRMSEVIAATYQKENIRCFALHPGAVPTPGAVEQLGADAPFLTEDIKLAPSVCVWLSNENPLWASGRYISATWDMDEFKSREEEIVRGDKLKFRMVV